MKQTVTQQAHHDPYAEAADPPLFYARLDIEKRLGFPAGRFTQAGPVLPALMAIAGTIAFYAALTPLGDIWLVQTFTERGYVPYFIVALSLYALCVLLIKASKIRLQKRAAQFHILPDDPDFVLTVDSADRAIERLHDVTDDPSRFMLLNRIHMALYNLRNLGRISDVDQVLRSQADVDEAGSESSYTVPRGLIWGIPVLGFIGTVIGLSKAIGSFGSVLETTTEMEALRPALQNVTGGLAVAFETTLQALVAAFILQMVLTMVRRSEEQMLDHFMEYCQRRLVHRLRLEPANASPANGHTQPADRAADGPRADP